MEKRILAIFDFDGTITDKDSMFLFLKFFNPQKFYLNIIKSLPAILFYFTGIYSRVKAKEILLSQFLTNVSFDFFQERCNEFSAEILPQIIHKKAMQRIEWHKMQEHQIVIISASLENWLIPWCKKYAIDLMATKMEVVNNYLTGKIAGENCRGQQKIVLLEKNFPPEKYDYKYGYGNSKGDEAFLAIVTESYFKPFE